MSPTRPWKTPAPVRKLQYNDIVTVRVGENEEPFALHGSILTAHSKFFRAAFHGKFKETNKKSIHLPEVDSQAFASFVQWIYTGKIVTLEPEDIEGDIEGQEQYARLVALYIVGDRVESSRLRNEVTTALNHLREHIKLPPDADTIKMAYDATPESSKLRRFILDSHLNTMSEESASWLQANRQRLPSDFIFDMAHAQAKHREGSIPRLEHRSRCYYHDHEGDDPKCG